MGRFLSGVFALSLLWGCGLSGQVQSTTSELNAGDPPRASANKSHELIEAVLILKKANVHGNPQTEILLQLSGAIKQVSVVATANAPCVQKAAQPDELIRVDCWWAGSGETFVIKTVEQALLITKLEKAEHGSPKAPKVLKKVSLKPGQRVSVKRSKK
jgi:hypothetical protein